MLRGVTELSPAWLTAVAAVSAAPHSSLGALRAVDAQRL